MQRKHEIEELLPSVVVLLCSSCYGFGATVAWLGFSWEAVPFLLWTPVFSEHFDRLLVSYWYTIRLEAIASRLEAIVIRLEVIASRLEAIAIRPE